MEDHSFLFSAFVFLSAAVLAVPISKRLGLGSVLGYLFAGIVIGPWGLDIISDASDILHFAEFGVVLLLFLIGLELNPTRLWSMRKPILGTGSAQVFFTACIFFPVGLSIGLDWKTSMIAAMGMALSSTAIALQIMTEKNLLNTPAGSTGFSILLFQDIAVIPMLAIIPMLGVVVEIDNSGSVWQTTKVFGVISLIIIAGHYLIQPLFRFIASSRIREMFTAFSLVLVIGIGLLMQAVDMSMALGTFLAGVILADSEYRHQLESDLEPFKGLLLGLFFISVGMSINFGLLFEKPIFILTVALGLVGVKFLVLYAVGKTTKLPASQVFFFSVLLSQGGEFAFVLFTVAVSFSALASETSSWLIVSVALSMMITPVLMIINDRIVEPRYRRIVKKPKEEAIDVRNSVIIAGFGRFGQIIARVLLANKIQTTVIDHSPEHIERVQRFGFKIYYGDATRLELLQAAGIEESRLLILAMDDWEGMVQTAKLVKSHYPKVKILARAWDMVHVYQLLDEGVEILERDTFESSLRLGEKALHELGVGSFRARQKTNKFRLQDEKALWRIYEVHKDEEQLITRSQEAREDLERLFEEDEQEINRNTKTGWG